MAPKGGVIKIKGLLTHKGVAVGGQDRWILPEVFAVHLHQHMDFPPVLSLIYGNLVDLQGIIPHLHPGFRLANPTEQDAVIGKLAEKPFLIGGKGLAVKPIGQQIVFLYEGEKQRQRCDHRQRNAAHPGRLQNPCQNRLMGLSQQLCRVLRVAHGGHRLLFGLPAGKARRHEGLHVIFYVIQKLLPGALPLFWQKDARNGPLGPLLSVRHEVTSCGKFKNIPVFFRQECCRFGPKS